LALFWLQERLRVTVKPSTLAASSRFTELRHRRFGVPLRKCEFKAIGRGAGTCAVSRRSDSICRTHDLGSHLESVEAHMGLAARLPHSKHPTRAGSCAIILANSGHASLSERIV
jgi:hypothetical protein